MHAFVFIQYTSMVYRLFLSFTLLHWYELVHMYLQYIANPSIRQIHRHCYELVDMHLQYIANPSIRQIHRHWYELVHMYLQYIANPSIRQIHRHCSRETTIKQCDTACFAGTLYVNVYILFIVVGVLYNLHRHILA